MSAYYSKVFLNTYWLTPYFEAHIPEDYPVSLVLQKCRAFRRLPPRLRELSGLAKQWARRCYPLVAEMHEEWYDDQGYELYPDTDRRLTDEEIDEQWDHLDLGLDDFVVLDIPIPKGGFADPATWEEPPQEVEPNLVDRDGLTREQILSDVASRGFDATAREYGVPRTMLPAAGDAEGLAQVILGMHGREWPREADLMTVSPGDDKGGRPSKDETAATVAAVSEGQSKRKHEALRAILRAPEIVQELYREGLMTQTDAARMGPKEPTPEKAAKVAEVRQEIERLDRGASPRDFRRQAHEIVRRELSNGHRGAAQGEPATSLERVLALALALSPEDRQLLIERLRAELSEQGKPPD